MAVATGYPDRIAKRRTPHRPELVLASGSQVVLSPASAVSVDEFVVVLDAEERGQGNRSVTRARKASAIDSDWLLELFLDDVVDEDVVEWDPRLERVLAKKRLRYQQLLIEESEVRGQDLGERAAELVVAAAREAGWERFFDKNAVRLWQRRIALVTKVRASSGLVVPTEETLWALIEEASEGCSSFAELRERATFDALRYRESPGNLALIDELAPAFVSLPSRRRVPVHYEEDRDPWIESRLQDFFGMQTGPRIGGGSVPLVLHLLAPNRRAVQVSSDLAGFWVRHYPAIRKQLMRRYPRHAWPDDPLKGHK